MKTLREIHAERAPETLPLKVIEPYEDVECYEKRLVALVTTRPFRDNDEIRIKIKQLLKQIKDIHYSKGFKDGSKIKSL